MGHIDYSNDEEHKRVMIVFGGANYQNVFSDQVSRINICLQTMSYFATECGLLQKPDKFHSI
jgi:hypothetical protein